MNFYFKVLGKSVNTSEKWLTNETQTSNQNLTAGEFLIQTLTTSTTLQVKFNYRFTLN